MFEKKDFFNFKDNGLIKIKGDDKFNFIQGIISNDINILKKKTSIFSSILTPQGKFLYDFFLTHHRNDFFLECNRSNLDEILKKLTLYKLRSDVSFEILTDYEIILTSKNNSDEIREKLSESSIIFFDPRFEKFFKRIYIKKNEFQKVFENLDFKEISHDEYHSLRIQNAIPDFTVDSFKEKSLLMEMRFEELNGISWEKGCYLGQEITARMKYRKIIKRKLVSFSINFKSELNQDILYEDKIIGSLMSHTKEKGIGYINSEFLEDDNNFIFKCGDSKLKIIEPWWV